jgi:transposase
MVIGRAIRKHGQENFTIQTICCAKSWKDLCSIEALLIEQYGTRTPSGFNISDGEEGPFGVKRTAESVERSAAKHRGLPCHPNTISAAIAFHLGRPKSATTRAKMALAQTGTIRSIATRAKISAAKMGRSINAGERNGHAKLTDEMVREARNRLDQGESQRSIARSFGVHYNVIWKVAHNLTWRCVT